MIVDLVNYEIYRNQIYDTIRILLLFGFFFSKN